MHLDARIVSLLVVLLAATSVVAADPPPTLAAALADGLRDARQSGRLARLLAPLGLRRADGRAPVTAPERETGEWLTTRGEDLGDAVRFEVVHRAAWQVVPEAPEVTTEESSLVVEVGADGRVRSFTIVGERHDDLGRSRFEATGVVEGGTARIESSLEDPTGETVRTSLQPPFDDDTTFEGFDRLVLGRLIHPGFPATLSYRKLVLGPSRANEERWSLTSSLEQGRARVALIGPGDAWRRELEVELDPARAGDLRVVRDVPPPPQPGLEGQPARSPAEWLPCPPLPARGGSLLGLVLGLVTIAVVGGLALALVLRRRRAA